MTIEDNEVSIEDVKYLLHFELERSRWNLYSSDSTTAERTNLTWEEAKEANLDERNKKRWINMNFRPISTSGKFITDCSKLVKIIDYDWNSYGWHYNEIKEASSDQKQQDRLLAGHFGFSVCRKLAFDPNCIDIDGHKWF